MSAAPPGIRRSPYGLAAAPRRRKNPDVPSHGCAKLDVALSRESGGRLTSKCIQGSSCQSGGGFIVHAVWRSPVKRLMASLGIVEREIAA